MKIRRLTAKSFGKLKNVVIELKPGLNIVYGKNEAGKSTIQTFIKGMFFGLRRKGKKGEISEFDKYTPWNSTEYIGSIEYDIDGVEYKVDRNFITNKVIVSNEHWEDISSLFPNDKKNGLLFAEQHLGLNEDCFENTVFVGQLGSKIENEKEIVDRLINMQESGSEDISYKNALAILEDVIKDKIGSDKTSKKPINLIDLEIEQLIKRKYESVLGREQANEIENKIKEILEKRTHIKEKIDYFNNAKKVVKRDNLLSLYNKSKEYENAIEKIENEITRLADFQNIPLQLEEKLREILIKIDDNKEILEQKKIRLKESEQKRSLLSQNTPIESVNNVYKTFSDFELMKQLVMEKDEYQNKLNENALEIETLVAYNEEMGDTSSYASEIIQLEKDKILIENKVLKLHKILQEIDNAVYDKAGCYEANNISFEDVQDILIKYKSLVDLKEKLHLSSKEGAKFEQEVYVQEDIISKLQNYSSLPDDIEDIVMKLQEAVADDNKIINGDNSEALIKLYKYQLGVNALLFFISCGLFSYGIYNVISGVNSIAYIITTIGLISTITFLIKFISSIKNIFNSLISKRVNADTTMNNTYESSQVALNKIYSSVGMSDFTSFMKNLYIYKDASQKLKMLKMDLNLKKQYIESIEFQTEEIQKDISQKLSFFNIEHNLSSITDTDILKLQEVFNNKSSINGINNIKNEILKELIEICEEGDVHLEDAEDIYNEFKELLIKINSRLEYIYKTLKINSSTQIIDKIEQSSESKNRLVFLNQENSRLKEVTYKIIERIVGIDKTIKYVLKSNDIEVNDDELVSEALIDILRDKFSESSKLSTEVKSLDTMMNSIEHEIKSIEENIIKLENEKKEILEVSLCEDYNEFFSACDKKRHLNNLVDEKQRLLNIHAEILNGDNSESLLQRITDIEDINNVDISGIQSQDDIENQIDLLKNELKNIDEEILNLRNEQKIVQEKSKELNEIVEKIEWLNAKKMHLIENKESIEIAIDVLKEASKELQREFAPRLQSEVSNIISQITSGKYSQVKTNEKLNINVESPELGMVTGIENLSMGTVEQFYLALRIALSNVLSSQSSALPIIIDEGFVQYDDDRVRNLINFLVRLSSQRQIIIFTCQSRELDIIKNLGLLENVNVVELSKITS